MKTLAYHSIEECLVKEAGAELYCVSASNFREQIKLIAHSSLFIGEKGKKPIADREKAHSSSLIAHGEEGKADSSSLRVYSKDKNNTGDYELRAKSQELILTFDDGDITNYTHAYPVLKEFKLSAYFFILVGRVGTTGYMNWEQIKELQNNGMIIGSHGMTHRLLTELCDTDLTGELQDSRKILEDTLGVTIDSLSIPRGFHNKRVLEKAGELGYKTIYTSDNRIAIRADWDLAHFERILSRGYSFCEKTQRFVTRATKGVLGPSLYDHVRGMLLR